MFRGDDMKWDEKPYHSLDYEMKHRFGEKVYRLSLNGGMTCPNRTENVACAAVFSAAPEDPVILQHRLPSLFPDSFPRKKR